MLTSSTEVGVAKNIEPAAPVSVFDPMTVGGKTVEEKDAENNASFHSHSIDIRESEHQAIAENNEVSPPDSSHRSCVLNLYTLELDGSTTRRRQGPVECSVKDSTVGEGLELAEPPSSSHNHDASMENHEVAETTEDEALVTDPTTSTSDGLVVVHTVSATPVVVDLATEENEAQNGGTYHGSEIIASGTEARIRRLQRVIGEIKRARYSRSVLG
ncbi:hypothetical protein TIFTF001_020691 [Ficus carica]|uniref:Uncharacterized protein n=1 Tax=Ficus carica TaxID=3494 RepID=A0AA88AYA1_FICCA|nr:hypothetical protein TIFTF001_020691 [Ficus carica]